MSIAFFLYCLWIAAAASVRFAPAEKRPVIRFGVLVASALPILLAAVTVGWLPAALALCGVVALFPAPMAAVTHYLVAQVRERVAAFRAHRAV